MKVGDLVEYVDSCGELLDPRELGTVTRDDHHESENHCYVVWHTAGNEGWWDMRHLKVVSEHEPRG
jgi:hypothetical protein